MAALRRTLFVLIATASLLFAFGSFTAALACPVAYGPAQEESDCCGGHEQEDCALLNCTAICQALPAAAAGDEMGFAQLDADYWTKARALEPINLGPEPPPPRLA